MYIGLFLICKAYDYMGDNVFNFNDKMLVVGDFKKILLITNTDISFDFKRYVLTVNGDSLAMPYLEDNEVGIKGIIKNINLKYKMVNDGD